MLKRYQILLDHRTGEHLKGISEKYDISFSEAIRILLALQIPRMVSIAYPQVKHKPLDKELVKMIGDANKNRASRELFHKSLSKIYFESQKSLESWFEVEKKRLKRNSQ